MRTDLREWGRGRRQQCCDAPFYHQVVPGFCRHVQPENIVFLLNFFRSDEGNIILKQMVNCLWILYALRVNFGLTESFLECPQQSLTG